MFCGLLLSSCVDMDLSPKDSPSEASVWSDPTMAEQVVTGVYKNLNHIPNDPYNMWMDLFTGMMDRDANWSNFGILRWGTWKDDKYFQFNAGTAANPVMEYNGLRQMWGQATYHYLWGGDHYNLWPIPLNEIQMNPNIKQNPGW